VFKCKCPKAPRLKSHCKAQPAGRWPTEPEAEDDAEVLRDEEEDADEEEGDAGTALRPGVPGKRVDKKGVAGAPCTGVTKPCADLLDWPVTHARKAWSVTAFVEARGGQ